MSRPPSFFRYTPRVKMAFLEPTYFAAEPNDGEEMINVLMENAVRHAKRVLVVMLRRYLKEPNNYALKIPPAISDVHFVDTKVLASEPEELRQLPMIIITNTSGNMVTAGLGDMCSEILDPRTGAVLAYRYTGFYELSFDVDIGCRTPLERETLADITAKAIRFDLRRFIQNNGVLVKDVSYGGETTVDYDSDKIYVTKLKVNTFSSWVEDRQLLDPDEFNVRVAMVDEEYEEERTAWDTRDNVLDEDEIERSSS